MTITGQSSLDKDDIDQMVKDAEAHAEEDRQRREEAEVRNNADTLVYQTEKVLREQGDKVSADEKAAVEQPLADLKKALDGTDIEAIKTATEKLMTASQAFSQKLYEAAARDANAAGTSASGQGAAVPTRRRRRRDRRRRDRRRRRGSRDDRRRRRPMPTAGPDAADAVASGSTTDGVDAPSGRRRRADRRPADESSSTTSTALRSPSATSSRTSPCACRPTSRTTASGSPRSRPTRPTGPPAGSPRRCCRCSTPARRPSPTAPTSVEPIWSALMLADAAEAGPRGASTSTASRSTPTVAEAVMHEPGDGGEPVGRRGAAHRLPLEGPRRCARPWCKVQGLSAPWPPQREWFEKDYYKILGVRRRRLAEGHHQGVPQAGARAPPRHQPRRRRGRGALQGDLGRLRRASATRPSARSTTRSAGSGPMGGGLGGGRRARRSRRRLVHVRRRRRPRRPARQPVRPRRPRPAAARPAAGVGPAARRRPRGHAARSRSPTPCTASPPTLHLTTDAAVLDVPRHRAPSPAPRPSVCPTCGGRGVVDDNQGFFSFSTPCPRCAGQRRRSSTTRARPAAAPASSAGRARCKVAHPGRRRPTASASASRAAARPAATAARPATCFVECHVEPHPLFGRDGDDLTAARADHVPEAALGADIEVPTLDGGKVTHPAEARHAARVASTG